MAIREKKKARTREKLLTAARVVFERDGVGARMEEIAAHAEVGTGTVYNYFPNKTALLAALCDDVVDKTIAAGERRLAREAVDAESALCGLLETYLQIARDLDRALLRQVLGAVFELPPEDQRRFVSMDLRMMHQIATMLGQLAARGSIRADVELTAASTLLYSLVGGAFMAYAGMPAISLRQLRAQLRQQVHIVVRGLEAAS